MEMKKLNTINREAFLTPEMYIASCDEIAEEISDIITTMNIDIDEIGLIGIARGGLPLMVGVSHRTGIRDCSSIQIKMNKSDNKDDYGIAHYINGNISAKKYYFVFEDIIYKGQSINILMNSIKNKANDVLGIFSIVQDSGFKENNVFTYNQSIVKSSYLLPKDEWTYFFWEKGYKKHMMD